MTVASGVLTVAGEVDATSLDISGNADIAGTTNLDAVDIDGAVQIDGTLTVGVDDQGYDVKLFGDTASAYILWDTSDNELETAGGATINIIKDKLKIGGTAVTTTAAELNFLDTAAANTVVNSKAVIYGSSGELAGTLSTAAQGNVTSLGTLSTLTVDNVIINGTTIGHTDDTDLITLADGAATFAGDVTVDSEHLVLKSTSPEFYFYTEGNHSNFMIAAEENVSATLEFSSVAATTSLSQTAGDYTPILKLAHGGAATFAGSLTAKTNFTLDTVAGDTSLTILDAGTNAMQIKVGAGDELYFGSNNTYQLQCTTAGNVNTQGDWAFPGNVAIGDQASGTKNDMLQVSSATNADGIILTGNGTTTGLANGNYRRIGFRYDDTDESHEAEIRFVVVDNTAAGGQMEFFTDNTGGTKTKALTLDKAQAATFAGTIKTTAGSIESSTTTSDAYTPTAYNDKPLLTLRSNNADTNYSGIRFTNSAGNYEMFLGSVQVSADTADIVFQGYDRGGGAYKEYIRINDDGNTTFAGNVDVGGAGIAACRFTSRAATDDSSAYALEAANSSGASLFVVRNDGYIGAGSTGVYNTFADVQMSGKGLSIKNDKNGSSNNWSYIQNDGTGSESTIIFTTGAQATAFKLNHDGSAVFTDNITTSGALSKGSGSFKIDHPLESKKDTHHLIHSFIEGPKADLIYRGKVTLKDGSATVNIDNVSNMTEGTFVALNTDVQCFTTNETNWDLVKGSISGNILTIISKNSSSTATISWMVIGERHDDNIKSSTLTDNDGKIIVEIEKTETE